MGQICLGILNSSTNRLWAADPGRQATGADSICEVTKSIETRSAALPTENVPNETAEDTHLGMVVEEAWLSTGATGAAIALIRGAEMVCCAATGPNAPDLGTRLAPDTGLSGRCAQTRELQQCSDTETDPYVNLEACRRLGVRSIVVMPLTDSGELFGIIEILSSRPNAFGPRDLDRLQALTDRIVQSRLLWWKANAAAPRTDDAVDPMRAELLAREVFAVSALHDSGARPGNYKITIRIAGVVALAVLLGWMVGNAGWKMAVDRAENQPSRSRTVEQASVAESETTSFSENAAGAHQTPQISAQATDSYVLVDVKPEYPEEAQQQRIQGRVVMKVLVGIDGLVRDIVVTSGDPRLARSAAAAVRRWRFRPHILEGQPVEFETQIAVNFALT